MLYAKGFFMSDDENLDLLQLLDDVLGERRKHTHSKHQVAYDCPVCSYDKGETDGDGKGNLEVNYKYNSFNCWSCGETHGTHGNIKNLMYKFGNKSQVARFYFIKPEFTSYKDKETTYQVKKVGQLPSGLIKIKKGNKKTEAAYEYLQARGVTDEIIERFNLHYGFEGDYYGRVVIPSYYKGNLVDYYVGRNIKPHIKLKYKNPDTPKEEIIFNKKHVDTRKAVFLVEGPFDHIVTPNSIPLLGKKMSEKLFAWLYKKEPPAIIIILDDDAKENAMKIYYDLNSGKLKNKIFIVSLPKGYDPSLFVQHYGVEEYKDYIKNNLRKISDLKIWE